MDTRPCLPTPPCLNVSRLAPQPTVHPAASLHEGWIAAQRGEPFDISQPPAWQTGYEWWKTHEVDMGVRALRQALLQGGVTFGEMPRPKVYPPI